MSAFWYFVIGMSVGACLGVVCICALIMARESDAAIARIMRGGKDE